MKVKSLATIALVSILAAAGAQAETYDGVHPLTSQASRSAVRSGAVLAAHSPDPYDDGADAGPPERFVSTVSRSTERAQAVEAAHSPDPYADGFDAGVPSTISSDTTRAAVRAQAVKAAHQPKLNVWGEAF